MNGVLYIGIHGILFITTKRRLKEEIYMKRMMAGLMALILLFCILPIRAENNDTEDTDSVQQKEEASGTILEDLQDCSQLFYDNLPEYHGEIENPIFSTDIISDLIDGREGLDKEKVSITAASLMIYRIIDEDHEGRFDTWTRMVGFSTPIPIYDTVNNEIFSYCIGIVDDNHKLVGYMIAGCVLDSCPVLEYSYYPDKYQYLTAGDCVYYSYGGGLIRIVSGEDEIDLDKIKENDLEELMINPRETMDQWTDLSELRIDDSFSLSTFRDKGEHSTHPRALASQTRVNMDTCDYTWQTRCCYTACAMFFDAIGRRVEPALMGTARPHSIQLNATLHSYMGHHPHYHTVYNCLLTWANSKKLSSYLTFSKYKTENNNASAYSVHKLRIDDNIPTLVGYKTSTEGHIMLGIGYASGNYYIVRDTFTNDGKAINAGDYYYNKTGYSYYVMGLTYSNSAPLKAWGTQTLRKGDNNFNVRRLRIMLHLLFYDPGSLTSTYFDTDLENTVKTFQSDMGLTADGIVGTNTYKKLIRAHIMRYDNLTANWRVLKIGLKGDDVAQLQIRLYRLGLYSGTCDGIFGTSTKNAVKQYQTAHGLTADGIVGTNTFAQLYGHYEDYPNHYLPCSICSSNS